MKWSFNMMLVATHVTSIMVVDFMVDDFQFSVQFSSDVMVDFQLVEVSVSLAIVCLVLLSQTSTTGRVCGTLPIYNLF